MHNLHHAIATSFVFWINFSTFTDYVVHSLNPWIVSAISDMYLLLFRHSFFMIMELISDRKIRSTKRVEIQRNSVAFIFVQRSWWKGTFSSTIFAGSVLAGSFLVANDSRWITLNFKPSWRVIGFVGLYCTRYNYCYYGCNNLHLALVRDFESCFGLVYHGVLVLGCDDEGFHFILQVHHAEPFARKFIVILKIFIIFFFLFNSSLTFIL